MVHLLLLLCTILVPFAHSFKWHDLQTSEEFSYDFPATSGNDPEVVSVTHTIDEQNTEERILEFNAYNKKIKLHLKPSGEVLVRKNTRVWTAKRSRQNPNHLKYHIVKNALDGIEMYYGEGIYKASISVTSDKKGFPMFDGIIDSNMVLRSLPSGHRRSRRNSPTSNSSTVDHIVYKIHDSHFDRNFPSNYDDLPKNLSADGVETVYPEILVMVDDALYSKFRGNIKRALSYLVTFWGGVDLRYRDLKKPQVRLNIAGIILFENRAPFLQASLVKKNEKFTGELLNEELLRDIGVYLYKNETLKFVEDYDAALFMTGYNMLGRTSDYNHSEHIGLTGSLGIAYQTAACEIDIPEEEVVAVAAIEDSLNFKPILHAAHELGHLFGAYHDFDASDCLFWKNEGHIMSYVGTDERRVQFSECSQQAMRKFFNSTQAACLRNVPANRQSKNVPRILPGRYLKLEEQCQNAGFLKNAVYDENVCIDLTCVQNGKNGQLKYFSLGPAAEGSPCAENMYCMNARCVPMRTSLIHPKTKN